MLASRWKDSRRSFTTHSHRNASGAGRHAPSGESAARRAASAMEFRRRRRAHRIPAKQALRCAGEAWDQGGSSTRERTATPERGAVPERSGDDWQSGQDLPEAKIRVSYNGTSIRRSGETEIHLSAMSGPNLRAGVFRKARHRHYLGVAGPPEGWRREGDSNPRYLLSNHAFQACALNHSAISPAAHHQRLTLFLKQVT